ncbi:MAG: diaminopropionate ammonia-lyase [Bacteroidales bacterium]|nr:diaminopropionate ammonia-lyase [Bacteroidales bacterium]
MNQSCQFILNSPDRPTLKLDRKFSQLLKSEDVQKFHKKLRCYSATPLVSLTMLAKNLGIKELYVKDESKRFRINTFKSLGASYAIFKIMEKRKREKLTFCTATDGNHGRSVAWAAHLGRQQAVIFVPENTTKSRIKNIKKHHAEVVVVEGDYDQAVAAAREASEKNDYVLVQDSSWEGYTEIPAYISAGYQTMMIEMEKTLHPPKQPEIDIVFLQCGNGTWASAMVAYYKNRYPRKMPKLVTVEPVESDAVMESFRKNKLTKTKKSQETIMAGLNCGTPSLLAWDILKDGIDAFLAIPDDYSIKAMQDLYYPFKRDRQIFAGEAGAAGLGGLIATAGNPDLVSLKEAIGLDNNSRVLVFNTEGVTDPDLFDEWLAAEVEFTQA